MMNSTAHNLLSPQDTDQHKGWLEELPEVDIHALNTEGLNASDLPCYKESSAALVIIIHECALSPNSCTAFHVTW